MMTKKATSREYTYSVDLDGTLWIDGYPSDVTSLYEAFYRTMSRHDDGRLFARCQGELCWVLPEDTVFVVDSIQESGGDPEIPSADTITLLLTGGVAVPLDPATLEVGDENVLYTLVREGAFRARFARKAYYQLARYVTQAADGFALTLDGRSYRIAGGR